MERIAFTINLKPGADPAEYKRRHDEIWPEMAAALRGAGIHNYSIFLDGSKLFAYLEVDDLERMRRALAEDATNARWQEYMRPMISIDVDPATGFARLLPEMFHLD
jgi:L-rhamnose mutarotase